jgi:putative RecB family exonuclease
MAKRIQSPSSINLYKQCPRRYFYQYIVKLPTKPSIHLIRGSIVHSVLEKFFELDVSCLDPEDYDHGFRSYVAACLTKLWKENGERLAKLGLSNQEIEDYLIDSVDMLNNFIDRFSIKLRQKMETDSFIDAFKVLTPAVEEEIVNEELGVRGFIDAIHDHDDEIVIMDYKTSKRDDLTPEYRLQLGIYALLYKLKYNAVPSKVGINFLKFDEKVIDVEPSLLEEAEKEVREIHEKTMTDNIDDYPKKESGLCKWSSGQCDFYDECMKD